MSHLNIMFVAAEATPLVKVGGLGDVVGSLPAILRQAGHDVRIVLPRYGTIVVSKYKINWQHTFNIDIFGRRETAEVSEIVLNNGTPVYLIGNKQYFDRLAIYGEGDDLDRFLFFQRAAMELPRYLNWKPDIVHSHDWHTAMCPAILQKDYREDPLYSGSASVFTIHNLSYQGWFDDHYVWRGNFYPYLLPLDNPWRGKTYSMMAMGIYYADMVSTVSDTYAHEILTPEFGCGLENLLKTRIDNLRGIVNGIDYQVYNPMTDPFLPFPFDANSIMNRVKNKIALQKKVGLDIDPDIPLIGMASRLVVQKGPDIAAEALEKLLPEINVQFILQGTGETHYRELLEKVEAMNTRKARLFFILDFALAQHIYGGSDIFLMPSRFEPCGLAPLIAMRYGSIPVVHRTGGLMETVPEVNEDCTQGLGFVFKKYDAASLVNALKRAISYHQQKKKWQALVQRAMATDFSWQSSLQKYEDLYQDAISNARNRC